MDDRILSALGDRLRALRTKRGLSQEEFAGKCRLDRTYVSGIERGRRNPSIRNIKRIASVLGVTLSQLFKGLG
jgi:transcriptional regulator with XRE-family HTH domain